MEFALVRHPARMALNVLLANFVLLGPNAQMAHNAHPVTIVVQRAIHAQKETPRIPRAQPGTIVLRELLALQEILVRTFPPVQSGQVAQMGMNVLRRTAVVQVLGVRLVPTAQ